MKGNPKKINIMENPPFGIPEGRRIIGEDYFELTLEALYSLLVSESSVVTSRQKKEAAEEIVALTRCMIVLLQVETPRDDERIRKTIDYYKKLEQKIIKAGGFGDGFDIFSVSKDEIEEMKAVLDDVTEIIKPEEILSIEQAAELCGLTQQKLIDLFKKCKGFEDLGSGKERTITAHKLEKFMEKNGISPENLYEELNWYGHGTSRD